MLREIEVRRMARRLIARYGDDAESRAVGRVDDFKQEGDFAAAAIWAEIAEAVVVRRTRRQPKQTSEPRA